MKAALALLLSLSAFSSEERLPSPPSCAEIGEQEKRQKLETTEREQLTRSRPVHQRQSSLKEIQNAIGLHDSALNTFQQLRRQVCERKAVDQEEIYQKAQERLQNASDSNQCSFYRDQKDLDAEASRKLTLYRDKMRDKLKEWKSILDNSILTNRNLIATARNQNAFDQPTARELNLESNNIWVGSRNAGGGMNPGFFVGLGNFLKTEATNATESVSNLKKISETMQARGRTCVGLAGAAERGDMQEVARIARENAERCRRTANFLKEQTGLSELCGNKSKGKCYEATMETLVEAGYVPEGRLWGESAYMAHSKGILSQAGFVNVLKPGITPMNAPDGSILVYTGGSSEHGHIELRVNGQNCSDYCYNGGPGVGYRLVGVYLPQNQAGGSR